jgi:hypothetical protein
VKYNEPAIAISIPVIINIKTLKPNLSISHPHKNLEEPFITPNNTPIIYIYFCGIPF